MKKYTDPRITIEAMDVSDIITASPIFNTAAEHSGDSVDFSDIVSRIM